MAEVNYPRTLAEKRIALRIFAVAPKDRNRITLSEWNAGLDASCRIAAGDFRLSPTGSTTVNDGALCEGAEVQVPGASQYEGSMTPFRIFDVDKPGRADTLGDTVFQALKTKGSTVFIGKRHSNKMYDAAAEAGDEIELYEVITDNRQDPSDVNAGYIKKVIPLMVQNAWLDAVIVADA